MVFEKWRFSWQLSCPCTAESVFPAVYSCWCACWGFNCSFCVFQPNFLGFTFVSALLSSQLVIWAEAVFKPSKLWSFHTLLIHLCSDWVVHLKFSHLSRVPQLLLSPELSQVSFLHVWAPSHLEVCEELSLFSLLEMSNTSLVSRAVAKRNTKHTGIKHWWKYKEECLE